MSMPTFPESGIDLTKEQAFHMLLGSIAMEELALSHIMNAEGEKLQYVLGTLPGGQNAFTCPTPQLILEVNRSITELLEQVTQSQLLLKNKLAQVLKAMENCEPAPPDCPHPGSETCLLNLPRSSYIKKGECLPWKPVCCKDGIICWNADTPANIYLVTRKSLLLNCSFQIRSAKTGPVILQLQMLKNNCWENVLICEAEASEQNMTLFLSGTTLIQPETASLSPVPLRFILQSPCGILAKQGVLTLMSL